MGQEGAAMVTTQCGVLEPQQGEDRAGGWKQPMWGAGPQAKWGGGRHKGGRERVVMGDWLQTSSNLQDRPNKL